MAPVKTPMTTLPVTFSRTRFNAAPEEFFRPSPMSSMPNRNIAKPPRSWIMALKISILKLLIFLYNCPFGT
jgi:hypothetical protein